MASARNRRSDAESVIWPQVLLVVAVVALTLIGFVMIYSASQVTILSEAATNYYADTEAGQYLRDTISYSDYIAQQNPSAKLISQFIYSLAGILIAVAIWFMLPRSGWKGAVVKGYWGVCVALLVITFLFGTAALGAQRWIVIGPLSLQPSEFAKIAIVLMAANLMDDLNEGDEFNSVMIRAALYVAAPTLFLLFTQSDLGTTIIIFVGVYAVLWFGGAPASSCSPSPALPSLRSSPSSCSARAIARTASWCTTLGTTAKAAGATATRPSTRSTRSPRAACSAWA